MNRTRIVLLTLLAVTWLGCPRRVDTKELYRLGPALGRLSRAVDSVADEPAKKSEALLEEATAYDPSLMEPFAGYQVEAMANGGYSVVIVCSKDGRVGLLEDAGCTPELDRRLWDGQQELPCEFTLDPVALCSEPQ